MVAGVELPKVRFESSKIYVKVNRFNSIQKLQKVAKARWDFFLNDLRVWFGRLKNKLYKFKCMTNLLAFIRLLSFKIYFLQLNGYHLLASFKN